MRPLLLLLALAFANGAYASTYTIVFTVPSTNSYVEGDSVFYCDGGGPTDDLAQVRFMRQDVIGGQPYAFDSLDVRGMEAQEDSLHVESGPGTHVYAIAVDDSGNGACWSAGVYLPGYVTAVGDVGGPEWRNPLSVRTYDVQGRLAEGHLASGVYRMVEIYADGRRRYTKIVVVR